MYLFMPDILRDHYRRPIRRTPSRNWHSASQSSSRKVERCRCLSMSNEEEVELGMRLMLMWMLRFQRQRPQRFQDKHWSMRGKKLVRIGSDRRVQNAEWRMDKGEWRMQMRHIHLTDTTDTLSVYLSVCVFLKNSKLAGLLLCLLLCMRVWRL